MSFTNAALLCPSLAGSVNLATIADNQFYARRKNPPGSRVNVVLGAQWGDEGKGKVVDLLATTADVVCRCQVSVFIVCLRSASDQLLWGCFRKSLSSSLDEMSCDYPQWLSSTSSRAPESVLISAIGHFILFFRTILFSEWFGY